MTGSDWYWAGWATTSFLAFIVPELWAVLTGHPGRKLSQSIWRLIDASPVQPAIWRILAIAAIVVLIYHLFVGPRH